MDKVIQELKRRKEQAMNDLKTSRALSFFNMIKSGDIVSVSEKMKQESIAIDYVSDIFDKMLDEIENGGKYNG